MCCPVLESQDDEKIRGLLSWVAESEYKGEFVHLENHFEFFGTVAFEPLSEGSCVRMIGALVEVSGGTSVMHMLLSFVVQRAEGRIGARS